MNAQLRQLRAATTKTHVTTSKRDDVNTVATHPNEPTREHRDVDTATAPKDLDRIGARPRLVIHRKAKLERGDRKLFVGDGRPHEHNSTRPMTCARVKLLAHAAVLGWPELARVLDVKRSLLIDLLTGRISIPKKSDTLFRARDALEIGFDEWRTLDGDEKPKPKKMERFRRFGRSPKKRTFPWPRFPKA